MNDLDFDNIGKRLYDMEADPPRRGWERIAPVVQSAALVPGWIRRNGWKPLTAVVPIALYIGIRSFHDLPETPVASIVATVPLPDTIAAAPLPERTIGGFAVDSLAESTTETKTGARAAVQSTAAAAESARLESPPDPSAKASTTAGDGRALDRMTTMNREKEEEADLAVDAVPANAAVPGEPRAENDSTPAPDETQRGVRKPINVRNHSVPVDETIEAPPLADNSSVLPDSSLTAKQEQEQKVSAPGWRLIGGVTALYHAGPLKPLRNDEVFVTKLSSPSSVTDKLSFGFAVGAGKAITNRIYVDAQLSYLEREQNIRYTYSTGVVDTLIAVSQPDQSIRVVPVLETMDREMISSFRYGGLRLTGTYYFAIRRGTRLNVSAGAGSHLLLSSSSRERVQGEWLSRRDEGNPASFTVSLSGGYNVALRHGWELMLNPAVTWFLSRSERNDVPYREERRFVGGNVMLIKYLH